MTAKQTPIEHQQSKFRSELTGSIFLHLIAIILLLVIISVLFLPPVTFAVSDTGLRYIQILNLIEHRWQTLAIDYQLRSLDPELRFAPYYSAYYQIDGDIFLSITPFFPILASFLYVLMGQIGLIVVPLVSGVLTALAIYKLAELCGLPHSRWLLWGVVFATPIVFYSLELWDHTLATALVAWSVYMTGRGLAESRWQPLLLGGILAGFSLGQRPEAYTMFLAMGISMLLVSWRKWVQIVGWSVGGLLGALPIWVLQLMWVGHPLGIPVAPILFGYGRLPTYAYHSIRRRIDPVTVWTELLVYIEGQNFLSFAAAFLICLGFVGFWFGLRVERWQSPRWLTVSFGLAATGYLIYAGLSRTTSHFIHGLLSVFPAMLIAFIPLQATNWTVFRKTRGAELVKNFSVYRFVYLSALVFIMLMVLLWPAYGGRQWGTRYMLLAYPLVFWLAWAVYFNVDKQLSRIFDRRWAVIGVGLLTISVMLQTMGVTSLAGERHQNLLSRQYFETLPDSIILTNFPYWPSLVPDVEEKAFAFVVDQSDVERLILQLYGAEIQLIGIMIFELEHLPIIVPERVGTINICPLEPFVYRLQEEDCAG